MIQNQNYMQTKYSILFNNMDRIQLNLPPPPKGNISTASAQVPQIWGQGTSHASHISAKEKP